VKGEGDLLAQKKKERAIKKVQGGQGDAEWGPLATHGEKYVLHVIYTTT